ncbi:DUF4365 domain-containing protein [Streptomyces sp. NPDC048441]|uniref:DUF4365 domain-containing protein n=1 Tax=Streptomyces sp. NPDC048441 TaxID=3365552 RepID=UPI003715A005
MQIGQSQQIEREGVTWIGHLVTRELGWIFREQSTVDVGIDAHFEVVDRATSRATGQLLAVQIKSGQSYFASPTSDGWWFVANAAHVDYWLGHSLPVIVALYNPETRKVYWQHVSNSTVVSTGSGWKVHLPSAQEMTADARVALRPLTRPASELESLNNPLAWKLDSTYIQGDWIATFELYRNLLAARLPMLFRAIAVVGHEHNDRIPVDLALWMKSGSGTIDVALIRPGQPLSHLIRYGEGPRYRPMVGVICGAKHVSDHPELRGARIQPPLFFASWDPESGDDQSLKSAVAQAITWIGDEEWL